MPGHLRSFRWTEVEALKPPGDADRDVVRVCHGWSGPLGGFFQNQGGYFAVGDADGADQAVWSASQAPVRSRQRRLRTAKPLDRAVGLGVPPSSYEQLTELAVELSATLKRPAPLSADPRP